MSELISSRNGEWDVHMLGQLFLKEEIKAILQIPIALVGTPDCLVWKLQQLLFKLDGINFGRSILLRI